MLTQERLKWLLTYNPITGEFTWNVHRYRWPAGSMAGRTDKKGYRCITVDGREYFAHRLAWLYVTGAWPKDQIDHRNQEKADNRWKNLREATQSQNMANKKQRNRFGFKGVHKFKNRYAAYITINNKPTYIGMYSTAKAANEAYYLKAKEVHGDFAYGGAK